MSGGRGASILASLIVLAIVGFASGALDFGAINSETQLALTGSTLKPGPNAPTSKQKQEEQAMKDKCATLKPLAKAQKSDVGGGETKLEKGQATPEKDRCVSAIYKGEDVEPECKGLSARVYINKDGTGRVVSGPNAGVDQGTCKTTFCKPPDYTLEQEVDQCSETKNVKGGSDLRSGAATPEIFATLPKEQQQGILASLSSAERDALSSALRGAEIGAGIDIEQARQAVDNAQERLQQIAEGCTTGCDANAIPDAQADLAKKQATLDALEAQQQRLAGSQNSLAEVAQQGPPQEPPAGGGQQPPAGGGQQPPAGGGQQPPATDPASAMAKARADAERIAREAGKALSTFGDPKSGGSGSQSPLSMLGQMLSSLAKMGGGLFGGGSSCGTKTTYQTQTVYVENYYGELVPTQRQVPVQSAVPCPQPAPAPAPAPGASQSAQCPTPPVQPDPSGCSGGSWRPTYNGACVANWQCVGGTIDIPLIAQITCDPSIVDARANLNIFYSCSTGTSAGAGFSTGGAQSGVTTVAVQDPPPNTNTSVYGIQCTSGTRTATKQCTVQVGKPSLVFVVNPEKVKSGNAATLGWVSTGMRSCVVSSPDLSVFTADNALKTNVNGVATTPALTSATRFLLHCMTQGGSTRDATSTVSISN